VCPIIRVPSKPFNASGMLQPNLSRGVVFEERVLVDVAPHNSKGFVAGLLHERPLSHPRSPGPSYLIPHSHHVFGQCASRLVKVEEDSGQPSIYYRVYQNRLPAQARPLTLSRVAQEGPAPANCLQPHWKTPRIPHSDADLDAMALPPQPRRNSQNLAPHSTNSVAGLRGIVISSAWYTFAQTSHLLASLR
jgi:hypothetical protein